MILDDPIFKRAPALQSLLKINDPKPEHVRACLMEMSRMFLGLYKRVEELEAEKAVANTNCVTEQLKATLESVDKLKEEYISLQDFVNAAKWRDIKEAMQKIVAMAEK